MKLSKRTLSLLIKFSDILKSHLEIRTFKTECSFVYRDQIPTAALYIVEGQVQVVKKSGKTKIFPQGFVVGLSELNLNRPVKQDIVISPNSKVYIITKSTIVGMLHAEESREIVLAVLKYSEKFL